MLDDCGQLFIWGYNHEGQLGFGLLLEEKVQGQKV
jgi:alpha-tubulin suppressor-like RCC1 family protein